MAPLCGRAGLNSPFRRLLPVCTGTRAPARAVGLECQGRSPSDVGVGGVGRLGGYDGGDGAQFQAKGPGPGKDGSGPGAGKVL